MAKARNRSSSSRSTATIDAQRRRNPLLYIGSLVVLVIITVTFVGTPSIARIVGAGATTAFGSYDGVDIVHERGNYFDRQIILIADQRRAQNVQTADGEAEFFTVIRQAFQRAVFHTAALAKVQAAGIEVSADRVDAELIETGPYVVGGQFSEERYNDTPVSERTAYRAFVEEQLLERTYLQDLVSTRTSSAERDFFVAMGARERRFDVAAFAFATLPDAELRRFGADNPQLFRRIKLSRILFRSGDTEAADVLQRLRSDQGTFEELARLYSADDLATGGEVGWRYFYDLERDFATSEAAESVFALRAGEVSDVLESRFGAVIYRADADPVAPDFAEPEVVSEVQNYLSRYERGFIEDFYAAQADRFRAAAQADGFRSAALQLGVATAQSEFFPINFQNLIQVRRVAATGSDVLQSAPFYEEFFVQGFALAADQVSAPIVLDDRILVMQLLEERLASDATARVMESYYDLFASSALQNDLQNAVFDSERFVDNFNQAVGRIQLGAPANAQGPPTQALF